MPSSVADLKEAKQYIGYRFDGKFPVAITHECSNIEDCITLIKEYSSRAGLNTDGVDFYVLEHVSAYRPVKKVTFAVTQAVEDLPNV